MAVSSEGANGRRSSVPVRFTVPPLRLNLPRAGTVKFPPRFTVELVAAIEPVLLQELLPPPRFSVALLAVIVEVFVQIPLSVNVPPLLAMSVPWLVKALLIVIVPPAGSPQLIARTSVPPDSSSIPLIIAKSAAPRPKLTAICPLPSAVAANTSTTALSLPPATATMSKFVSTAAPLMLTLKRRWPALLKEGSAKCSRSV